MADRNNLLGRGMSYPFAPDPNTGGAQGVSAVDSVRASLRRLFDTVPGEERFNPAYGCGLRALVFENDTLVLRALCDTVIREAVARWEPRIAEVVDIQVTVSDDPNDQNTLHIRVFFRLLQSQVINNFVYPFAVQG